MLNGRPLSSTVIVIRSARASTVIEIPIVISIRPSSFSQRVVRVGASVANHTPATAFNNRPFSLRLRLM